ncbi:MAG TPA: rod-binding protein [Candidatus Saccharimonadales bacterium]|jgi:flagellar protein FlgJ|nr:rod-binding protein [Candidatus Saccharimonadales bacterium]
MNIRPALGSTHTGPSVPLEQLAANKNLSEPEKVNQASRQFEAVILRQILSQARKPVFPSKLTKESTASGIYQDLVTGQLADAISQNGSFGLAHSLQAQLHRQASPPPSGPAPGPTQQTHPKP